MSMPPDQQVIMLGEAPHCEAMQPWYSTMHRAAAAACDCLADKSKYRGQQTTGMYKEYSL